MLKKENPLSLQSKLGIVELAYNMNKDGKRRIISKSEYIELLTNAFAKETLAKAR